MSASEKLMTLVKSIESLANTIECKHRMVRQEVQRKAGSRLDVFSSSFPGQVMDIGEATQKNDADAYAGYQMLVLRLDKEGRKLLEGGANARSVREAVKLLQWLNDHSNFSTRFSGTLNGRDMGDITGYSYTPALECIAIQKYWEASYDTMPGKKEAEEAVRREYEAAAEARRKKEAEYKQAQQKKVEEKEQRAVNNAARTLERRAYLEAARNMISHNDRCFAYFKSDGTAGVKERYSRIYNETPDNVQHFSDLKAIVATGQGVVGLRKDGTCVVTGCGTNRKSYLNQIKKWENISAISAGFAQVVGLRYDGTCVAVKDDGLSGNSDAAVSGWSNIKQVVCGSKFTVGLKKDGTCVYTGDSRAACVTEWKDVAFLADAQYFAVGITKQGKILCSGSRLRIRSLELVEDIVQLVVSGTDLYALTADGRVHSGDGSWVREGQDVVAMLSSGSVGLYLLKNDGSVVLYDTGYSGLEPPKDLRLFENYDRYQKQIAEEQKRIQEERRQQEQLRKKREDYMRRGKCRHCGGEFEKKLFGWKCISCKKRKDY